MNPKSPTVNFTVNNIELIDPGGTKGGGKCKSTNDDTPMKDDDDGIQKYLYPAPLKELGIKEKAENTVTAASTVSTTAIASKEKANKNLVPTTITNQMVTQQHYSEDEENQPGK